MLTKKYTIILFIIICAIIGCSRTVSLDQSEEESQRVLSSSHKGIPTLQLMTPISRPFDDVRDGSYMQIRSEAGETLTIRTTESGSFRLLQINDGTGQEQSIWFDENGHIGNVTYDPDTKNHKGEGSVEVRYDYEDQTIRIGKRRGRGWGPYRDTAWKYVEND